MNAEKFKEIEEGFPKSFRNARQWCHVFVTDDGEYAEALRDQAFPDLPLTRLKQVRVSRLRLYILGVDQTSSEQARRDGRKWSER